MTSRHDVMAEEHLRVWDAVGRYVLITALIHRLFESLTKSFDKKSAKRRPVPERHCETSQYVYASRSQLVAVTI